MTRKSARRGPQGPSSPLLAVVATAVVVIGGVALAAVITSGSDSAAPVSAPSDTASSETGGDLPEFVLAAPRRVRDAYVFAAQRPDLMMWMPCYCGCGEHSGHKSAKNCFVGEGSTADSVQWDMHAAGCDMCVDIALDVKEMSADGASLSEMRAYIDETYGSIGPGTDTPLPPA